MSEETEKTVGNEICCIKYDYNESILDILTWAVTFVGAVLWGWGFFAKIELDYFMISVCMAIGILILDWVLMWGTSTSRLKRVLDRRVVITFTASALVLKVLANELLLSGLASGGEYIFTLVISGSCLGASLCLLLALIIKKDEWHFTDYTRTKRVWRDSNGNPTKNDMTSIYAYPSHLAGQPKSLRRVIQTYVLTALISISLYVVNSVFVCIGVMAFLVGFSNVFQSLFFSGLIDVSDCHN